MYTKAQRKGAVTPRGTEPKFTSVGGSLWRLGSAGAHHRDEGTGNSSLGKSPLVYTLLEVSTNPTIALEDQRAGSPQAKKLPGGKHNPIHLQITGLKLY